ncbi:hypothetical protein [Rothia nasimurium]|uniref:hypothetical protein n=1 Tax=Rothia nasimurium TaxID=85336 RepID=UPI001F2907AD|nr:hypothetical protein [Rothia nasimurium]
MDFTPVQTIRLISILSGLYSEGKFSNYKSLAEAIDYNSGNQNFAQAVVSEGNICHQLASRIVDTDGNFKLLTSSQLEEGKFSQDVYLTAKDRLNGVVSSTSVVDEKYIVRDIIKLQGYFIRYGIK